MLNPENLNASLVDGSGWEDRFVSQRLSWRSQQRPAYGLDFKIMGCRC